ncbi:phosphate transport system regulatory protein PhoU [Methanocella sp. CWC-04]|uniref:Phosphate transport system regulatory protein PhoU n=1 Tax=Methanooceanicella nereidis TaxID=2052831 RepID=A0AAP2RBP3_9EURY|nr:PhoU domain-containing protein [Methanocella sp. CWC-04]MCD1294112.1 phosphate transport system regulatory protein PhoU [Methanocella sp. CWC-04]
MPKTMLKKDIETLRSSVSDMMSLAEEMISDSIRSLYDHDMDMANSVIGRNDRLKSLERDIDDMCIELLKEGMKKAQLREVASAYKFVIDLESIGYHSMMLANVTLALSNKPLTGSVIEVSRMSEMALDMLRICNKAYRNGSRIDLDKVFGYDREIEKLNNDIFLRTLCSALHEPETLTNSIYMIMASRELERIGDHISDLARRVDYIQTGKLADRMMHIHIPEQTI